MVEPQTILYEGSLGGVVTCQTCSNPVGRGSITYYVAPSTVVGSVMTDNEEGNEGVSQKITFHGIGAEGIKKLITIVRGGGPLGPPFSIMRYVNNPISVH